MIKIVTVCAAALAIACGPEMPANGARGATDDYSDAGPPLRRTTEATPLTEAAPQNADAGAATLAASPDGGPSALSLPPPRSPVIRLAHLDGSADDAELGLGDAALQSDDYAGADAHYAKAEKAAPKDIAAKVGRARVLVARSAPDFGFAAAKNNRDVTAASQTLKRLAADPANASYGPLFAELGHAELLLGLAPDALPHLKHAAELLPQEPEVASALGVASLATGDAQAALVALRHAVDLDMGSAPRHGNLGTVYFMLGQVKDAIGEYEIEVRLADGEPRAHSDLGTALLASNDVTRGIAELRRAVAIDPNRATFHSNLGYALQLESKRTDAIAEYREALRLDPKLVSAWVNLATALARDPKTRAEARTALDTANKLDPKDPRVKANLEELDALEKGQILH